MNQGSSVTPPAVNKELAVEFCYLYYSFFIQGSGIAPVFYDFNSSDLRPANPLNRLNKYADDIMLLVGADAAPAIPQEIDHVNEWATRNNLQLNKAKSKEIIIRRPRVYTGVVEPQPIPELLRVDQMKILGSPFPIP